MLLRAGLGKQLIHLVGGLARSFERKIIISPKASDWSNPDSGIEGTIFL